VTVAWQPHTIQGEDYLPGPQVLAPELTDPRTTPLGIEVFPEPNHLGLLVLKTPSAPRPVLDNSRWFERFPLPSSTPGER
jgi:hypothetical protein